MSKNSPQRILPMTPTAESRASRRGCLVAAAVSAGLLLWSTSVWSEGSRTLFPSGYVGGRAPLNLINNATAATVIRNRAFIYVYAESGEYILTGSSNRDGGSPGRGNIQIYNPQNFGSPGNETVPSASAASFSCNTGAAAADPLTNFDAAGFPPAGWSSLLFAGTNAWGRFTGTPHAGAGYAAVSIGATTISDALLVSPPLIVGAGTPRSLSFFQSHDMENGNWDGTVLEISINGGPFQDVLAAGGSFTVGGYTGTLVASDNPLTGRQAWASDSSGGYVAQTYQLPGTVTTGDLVSFRWRFASDSSVASTHMRIDTITAANLTAPAAAPGPHFSGDTLGRIQTRAAELAGPRSANNVNGSGSAWTPCAYRAPVTGIYGLVFSGSTIGAADVTVDNIATDPEVLQNQAAAWDVSVRSTADSTTDINGRIFSYAWVARTAGNGPTRRLNHTLYYITTDGYRYSQRLNNLDPFSYSMYGNRAGFLDAGNPLYRDVRGDNFNVTTINPGLGSGVTAQAAEYPVFLSNVADTGPNDAQVELVLAALGIPNVPPVPQLNTVSFSGSVAGNTTGLGIGGTFTFNTVNTLTYQIVIAGNTVTPDYDPALATNRVLTGVAVTGTHNVVWDGLDNAGNPIPVGNGYNYRVEGRNGEVHFPLVDPEGMTGGGATIIKLNGATPGDATVYYDDRGYRTSNNVLVGAEDGHLCGAGNAQVQPSPVQGLAGVDSSSPYRIYTGETDSNTDCASGAANAFGSAKVLDTWALERTPVTQGELNIVPLANEVFLTVVKTGVPGPIDLEITNSTTYTLTVTNTGDDATTGNIVINDNLRSGLSLTGFSGTNWSCVGPTSVVCTYSGPALAANGGSTSVQITVSIAALTPDANNTGRVSGGGDPVCLPPPAVLSPANALRCTSTVTIGTVPVTLSYISATVNNGQLQVDFTTLAEAGTAGFRVLGGHATGSQRHRLSSILQSKGSSLAPQNYRVLSPHSGESVIWVEEITSDGTSKAYGPYAVGNSTGEQITSDLIDWPNIRSQLNNFTIAQSAAVRLRGVGTNLEAEIALSVSGLARVSFEDMLAQGIDWSGTDPARVALFHGSEHVGLRYSGPALVGPGSTFSFLGESVSDSLYTRTAVYRLRVLPSPLESMPALRANPVGLVPITTIGDRFVHAPNRDYDLSARDSDPYSAFRLFRDSNNMVSRTETFNLPDLVASAGGSGGRDSGTGLRERIEVDLWSDFDLPHSVRLLLNNSQIGLLRFTGRDSRTVGVDVPPGLLMNGSNSLRMELLADTGQEIDSVNLEEIRVYYTRRLVASANTMTFSLPGDMVVDELDDNLFGDGFSDDGYPACQPLSACTAYRVTGLTSPDVVVLRQRDGQVAELTGARITGVSGTFELVFASNRQAGDRYWVEPRSGRVATTVAPALPVVDPLEGGPANYLIVSHGSFIPGLAPFIAARQAEGLTVRTVDVQDLYRFYGTGEVNPKAIGLAIKEAAQRLGTNYVLLVGGDTRDYLNFGGSNSISFIPTHYRQVGPVVTFAPTDVPFADLDGDDAMDIALGRWPVRTLAELSIIVDKTLAYAQADHGGKAVLFSDRNEGPVSFGTQLRLVPAGLGIPWLSSSIPLHEYPATPAGTVAARNDLVSAINAGQSLMVFMGHGAPLAWTQEGLITSQLLINGMFSNPTRPTVAWAVGCYGTYFTQPAYNSVSHGLLTRNANGAAAVFGASTLTEIAHDIAWVNALSYQIRGPRLGESLRMVQNRLRQSGDSYKDIWMGVSLLGDPALRLREAN